MDIPWGSDLAKKFITNVGLITTNGSNGHNIMAAEWTHHISYSPGLIAVCVCPGKVTHENIKKQKEFGISITAEDQDAVSSVSGGYSGKEYDKITALKELGVGFYNAKKIDVLMVKDVSANFECKLVKELDIGSHTIFIGEVLEANDHNKQPLGYHGGKYWILEKNPEKPSDKERKRIADIVEKHKK